MAAGGPQSHPRILQRRSEILDGVPSRRRWIGAAVASVLLVAVGASVGLGSHPPVRISGLTAVARSAATSGEQRPEDLATVAFGQQYVFPSGVGVAVAAPVGQVSPGGGSMPIVVVRTTVLNHAATPYDMDAVLGPSASYDGREVERLTDSRYGVSGVGGVVPPGHHSVYETTFPAGSGRLTLQYRVGFESEAVQFGDPVRSDRVVGGHP
jgi:hypothetical protein